MMSQNKEATSGIAMQPTGLTSAEAEKRLREHGPNRLAEQRGVSWIGLLARQFSSALILLLFAAVIVTAAMGHYVDATAILIILLLNGGLGFVQEWRAERTLQALRSILTRSAVVIRDGLEREIPSEEIVLGDVVVLDVGNKVPADLELLTASELTVDESVLTGEAASVDKRIEGGEKNSARVFMGTNVVSGNAKGTVISTGMNTEFGRIAELTTTLADEQTHLQKKLTLLGRHLGILAIVLISAIVALGWLFGKDPVEMVLTGISLAVAAVPEGLPAVVTITLAFGAKAMVRKKALIRTLQATETLGASTAICTDKTGTLTENQMTVTGIWLASGAIEVTGTGYEPEGSFERDGLGVEVKTDPDLNALLKTAIICNHAHVWNDGTQWQSLGKPTEAALVTAALKAGLSEPDTSQIVHEISFSSERKRMSVVQIDRDIAILHVKGALEKILPRCARIQTNGEIKELTDELRQQIRTAHGAYASKGLRVLCAARRTMSEGELDLGELHAEETESNLVFLGLFAIMDPPRPEVREAIAQAQSAGVKIVMITGDAPETASAIAASLKLPVQHVLTGDDLVTLSDESLDAALSEDVLFARTTPEHKMRIVDRLSQLGHVVAMTGDGVNDAPALKRADIGIAMGIRGTDVAKDAADIVLLDDNFASIVEAIREGRRQYANIKKFVRYLLTSNAGEVVAISANIIAGGPLIFIPIQILWMNLVTDGVTALSLSAEKPETDVMEHRPHRSEEDIVGRNGLIVILLMAAYTGSTSLWVFYSLLDEGVLIAQTAAFTTMIFLEKFSVFAFRSLTLPTAKIGYFSNPWLYLALTVTLGAQIAAVYWPPLQAILHTSALPRDIWLTIFLVTLPVVLVPETIKLLRNLR